MRLFLPYPFLFLALGIPAFAASDSSAPAVAASLQRKLPQEVKKTTSPDAQKTAKPASALASQDFLEDLPIGNE